MKANIGSIPPMIVGIGASAGGLAAFKTFLANVPRDPGMAFVLVQHLDPNHKSLLVELLGVGSALPVVTVIDGVLIETNCVYVIPPDATLTINKGVLRLKSPAPERSQRRPIDTFFVSLAEEHGVQAAGIILSGVGSDGSAGIRAIKERGGLTFAQAEFDRHALSGMPDSAAATGMVDYVLPVEAMPGKLSEHLAYLNTIGLTNEGSRSNVDLKSRLPKITELLQASVNHDFSGYKEKTLLRRLQRRMQVLQLETADAYIDKLSTDPDEASALFRELLIGVTEFFRDPDAFEALKTQALQKFLKAKSPNETIRVWVAGCSTGEEVYSLAILINETLAELGTTPLPVIQIFGTDIDAGALSIARAGRYGENAAKLSTERLERWFIKDGDDFCVLPKIRGQCLFSAHSLVKDPPFSKLDLISCRNLLIYLDSDLQGHAIKKFHFALNPGGTLFLGSSEGIGRYSSLFTTLDKKHRILKRNDAARILTAPLCSPVALPLDAFPTTHEVAVRARLDDHIDVSVRRVMDHHAPAYFVIDHNYETLRFSGGEVRHFLEPSPGVASLNLFQILLKSLRPAVRVAIQKAVATQKLVVADGLPVSIDGVLRDVTLIVEPLADGGTKPNGVCLVAFRDTPRTASPDSLALESSRAGPADTALHKELIATRNQLKFSNDELETTVEDMRSASEEFQVMNEELQSANEELETAKEEMQSINEELQTVNSELSTKNDQMKLLNSDLKNLLDSTRIAAVFLDDDLHIRHFTPAMTEIFPLRDSDRGRPITEIVNLVDYEDLKRDVAVVKQTQSIVERDVALTDNSATFLMRIRPYRTATNAIDGAVLTFFDITQRSRDDDQKVLIAKELQHRTGNLIAVILSIVNRTLAGDRPIEAARGVLTARLIALAKAHALLTVELGEGAPLDEIVRVELTSFSDRVQLQGPRIILTPAATQGFALIVHELATNAAKHGALSNNNGIVSIVWAIVKNDLSAPLLSFVWSERGGPSVQRPTHTGFGTKLLERAVNTFDQPAVFAYAPDGFSYDLRVPLSSIATIAWLESAITT